MHMYAYTRAHNRKKQGDATRVCTHTACPRRKCGTCICIYAHTRVCIYVRMHVHVLSVHTVCVRTHLLDVNVVAKDSGRVQLSLRVKNLTEQ